MISRTAAANSLHTDLQNLCKAIKTFADAKPSVTGSERLLKRAQRDCSYVDSLLEVAGEFTSSASVMKHLDASPSHDLHGVRNNLRGLQAELDLACQAEAVVCLGAKFYSNVSAGVYCFKSIISILQRTESIALWLCLPPRLGKVGTHAGSSSTGKKSSAQKMLANHFVPSGKSVEIDVVAQQASMLAPSKVSLIT